MAALNDTQKRIERSQELLNIYEARLHQRRKQVAYYGISADPAIKMETEDLQKEIELLRAEIVEASQTLSKPFHAEGTPNVVRLIVASMAQEQQLTEETPADDRPAKFAGLVLLVGTGRPNEDPMQQSAGDAINYHVSLNSQQPGLRHCWLIASAGERGSESVAKQLQAACQQLGVTATIELVQDAFNVQESYNLIQQIYWKGVPEAGLTEQEVIADFTGGVKPMSAGMILACANRRSMQYFTGRKAGIPSIPHIIRFTPWSETQT